MKLFKRRPRRDAVAELHAQMDAAPGQWFDYPENTLMLAREAFLFYDVQGDPGTGRVQIRKKPVRL